MVALDEAGRAARYAHILQPPPDLAHVMEHAWIARLEGALCPGDVWKIVPDVRPHLLVHRDAAGTRSGLVGARSVAIDVPVARRHWTVGVRLRPGSLPLLTGHPACELTDRWAPVDLLRGSRDAALGERLADVATPEAGLQLVLRHLRAVVPPTWSADWKARCVTRAGMGSPGGSAPTVASVARASGVSVRGLRQAARTHLGLPPQTAFRVRRLYDSLRRALAPDPLPWGRIAVLSGFHDGAHLTHDFRALMGEPPSAWVRRADSYKPRTTSPE